MTRCIKYWLKLVCNIDNRYHNHVYSVLYMLDGSGRTTWASEIRLLLYTTGFGHVWLAQGVGNTELFLHTFKLRLSDISLQTWHSDTENNLKLGTYCIFKTNLDIEIYLSVVNIRKYRISLSKLRCSSHKLAIERLRGRTTRDNRICKFCLNNNNVRAIEGELHFILICPLYTELRLKYFQFDYTQTMQSFINIMSSKSKVIILNLACYIYHATIMHKHFNNI